MHGDRTLTNWANQLRETATMVKNQTWLHDEDDHDDRVARAIAIAVLAGRALEAMAHIAKGIDVPLGEIAKGYLASRDDR
jgi:hypothetical protein